MRAWGLTDGSAGMKAQIDALAGVMGYAVEHKTVEIAAPWSWLSVALYTQRFMSFIVPEAWRETIPDVVISCGRRGAMMALALKNYAPNTRFVCLQDPRISAHHFNLVLAMEHDKISGVNVIKTKYALHRITPELLDEARELWEAEFQKYSQPRIALLFGGTTNRYRFTEAHMQRVIYQLQRLRESLRGSLLITPSRRTGQANIGLLSAAFAGGDGSNYVYDGTGANPYLGMLAIADFIIVTNDSVNMMTEAYATGKPLYILRLPGHNNTKPSQFAEMLVAEKAARWLDVPLEKFEYDIKNEMTYLKEQVLSKLR